MSNTGETILDDSFDSEEDEHYEEEDDHEIIILKKKENSSADAISLNEVVLDENGTDNGSSTDDGMHGPIITSTPKPGKGGKDANRTLDLSLINDDFRGKDANTIFSQDEHDLVSDLMSGLAGVSTDDDGMNGPIITSTPKKGKGKKEANYTPDHSPIKNPPTGKVQRTFLSQDKGRGSSSSQGSSNVKVLVKNSHFEDMIESISKNMEDMTSDTNLPDFERLTDNDLIASMKDMKEKDMLLKLLGTYDDFKSKLMNDSSSVVSTNVSTTTTRGNASSACTTGDCKPAPLPDLTWLMPVDLRFPNYNKGYIVSRCVPRKEYQRKWLKQQDEADEKKRRDKKLRSKVASRFSSKSKGGSAISSLLSGMFGGTLDEDDDETLITAKFTAKILNDTTDTSESENEELELSSFINEIFTQSYDEEEPSTSTDVTESEQNFSEPESQ